MGSRSYYKRLKAEFEHEHYRDPDHQDSVYERELACIEVAKNATIAAKGDIYPTFAPKQTAFNRIFRGSRTYHTSYLVSTVKTVFWLWQKYRPTPWINADNQGTLESWLHILYGQALAQGNGLSELILDVDASIKRSYTHAAEQGYHVTVTEKWQQVVERVSEELPPYG